MNWLYFINTPLRLQFARSLQRAVDQRAHFAGEQMLTIAKQLKAVPQTMPIIVAGDFNMPQTYS